MPNSEPATQPNTARLQRILVICPVYNEERNIQYFFERLKAVFAAIDPRRYECRLLFTNNRSSDQTLQRIRELHLAHDWIDYITLSRNHGYQRSVLSGLASVEADFYMVCDVDCEDPPELLAKFLQQVEAGSDHVYGIRSDRPEPWLMLKARAFFYWVLRSVGDNKMIPYMAEFGLFRRCVRDVLVANSNSFPFLRAEIGYAGFVVTGVPYKREPRRFGKTHYNVVGNTRFAIAGLLTSTTFPLRVLLYLLPILLGINALACILYACSVLSFAGATMTLLSMNLSYLGIGLAFSAVYLARIYQNGLGRPRFIVDWTQTSLSRPEAPQGPQGQRGPAATPTARSVEAR